MDRKDKKQDKKKTRPATKKKQTKMVKPRAAKKIESELAQVDEKLHKMAGLLENLPQGVCFFNKQDEVTYSNESFTFITGIDQDSIKGKKLRKNQLWGTWGQKDEFKELFQKAKEVGSPLTAKMLTVASSKAGERLWNVSLLPQKEEDGEYNGMGLVIEDVTGKKPAPEDSLFNTIYSVAVQHSEIQPLLENLVAILKDYTGCSTVKIAVVDRVRDRAFIADSDKRAGLWDTDKLLSPAEIDRIFNNGDGLPEEYRSSAGSVHLNNIREIEAQLTGILRDMVINSSNSYGFNSIAFIPIRFEGWIQGFVQVANARGEIPVDRVTMIENISNQLQIILEHAGFKEEMRTQREGLLKQMNERSAHLEAMSERLKQEVSERKKAQEEMKVQRDLAMALNEIEVLDEALQLCLETAIRVSGMDCGGIYLIDNKTQDLVLACEKGISPEFKKKVTQYGRDFINYQSVSGGNAVYLKAGELEAEISDRLNAEKIRVIGVIPVIYNNTMVAVLNIASHEIEDIAYSARSAVEAIAAEIGSVLTRIQNREAYKESEKRHKTLFARTSNPVLVIDEDGNYIDANDAALAFLECSRGELLAMNVRDTLPPYLDDQWFAKYRAIWQDGGTVERDYYVWGKIKVLEITITPLQLGNRKVFFGIGNDITERKRIESELRANEEKYRLHFENVNDVIYSIDTELKITDISPSVERILGYKPEEIIGKTAQELIFVDPPTLEMALANIRRIFNGEVVKSSEYKLRNKNGDIVYAEISGAPLHRDGKLVGVVSIARDVTDRKKAEDAVKKSEEKYRTILEEMDESYYEIDAKGNFIDANEAVARRFGYTREEFIGLNYETVTREEDIRSKAAIFSKVFQTGRPRFWQPLVGVKKDGTLLYVEDSIHPLKNEKGEIVGLRGIGRDVTERRLWEATLKESEEKFRRLFYQSPVGAAMVSLDDYRFVSVNETFCDFTGYSDEELVTMSFRDITHPDNLGEDIENINSLVKGEIDHYITDKQYVRKDGSAVWGHVSVRLIKDSAGRPLYLLPVIEDITARRKAEQRLGNSESMFKNIIEHITDVFYIQDMQRDLLYISPQVESLLGYSVQEMMGGWQKFMTDNPWNAQGYEKSLRAFNTGEKQEPYLLEFVSKSGKDLIAEINESPLKDEQGNVTGMVGVARDVNAQIMAEEELRSSEQRYHGLANFNRKLNEIYIKLNETSSSKELTSRISESLRNLTEAMATSVSVYNRESGALRVAAVTVDEALEKKVQDVLNVRLHALEFAVPAEIKSLMLSDVIVRPKDLFDTSFGMITQEQSDEIMVTAGIAQIVGLSLNYGSELVGTAIAFLPAGNTEVPDEVLKTFSYMAGLAIFKKIDEDEIKASQERFRNIVEHIEEVFFIQDGHNKFIYLSPQYERVFGYTMAELNENWESMLKDNPLNEAALNAIKEAASTGKKQPPYPYEFFGKDGSRMIMEVNETPLMDAAGNFKGFVGVARDITERKSIEQELIESEAKYRSVVENAGEAIYVAQDGKLTYVNKRTLEITGYSAEELGSRLFIEFIHPDDRDMVRERYLARLKGESDPDYYTFRIITKTGSVRWIGLRFTRIQWGGKPATLNFSTDVTEFLEAEGALKESEERYRLLADNLMDIIVTTDMDMAVTYISPSVRYIIGWTAEDILKMCQENKLNAEALGLSEADADRTVKGLRALVQDPSRTQIIEFELKHRDGFTSWTEVKMSIMRDKNGQAAGILGVIRDITQQKKMTERLIRSDRLASLGEMAAGLAQEVNNPLTAVMGFAYLVLQNPNTPPEIKNNINSIYNEGKRAADVIKNFLIFARGRKLEKQSVFINDIIESTLRLRHSQMTKENITVLLNLAEDLPAINGDISQLQQVFLNIILNAEHFMYQTNKRGTLAITTLQDEGRIKICISDDGPGIPQDKIHRVFDPFYTTKRVGEGTGLGLSICHGIISEHGGNIYAESRPGEGTTFIIDLPSGK